MVRPSTSSQVRAPAPEALPAERVTLSPEHVLNRITAGAPVPETYSLTAFRPTAAGALADILRSTPTLERSVETIQGV